MGLQQSSPWSCTAWKIIGHNSGLERNYPSSAMGFAPPRTPLKLCSFLSLLAHLCCNSFSGWIFEWMTIPFQKKNEWNLVLLFFFWKGGGMGVEGVGSFKIINATLVLWHCFIYLEGCNGAYQLISHLINKEYSEGMVLVGHSTGCQVSTSCIII